MFLADYNTKNFSTVVGFVYAGVSVGVMIFPPMANLLIEAYGWRGAILIQGGMVFHIVAFGAIFRPVSNSKRTPMKSVTIEHHKGDTRTDTQDGIEDVHTSTQAMEVVKCEECDEKEQSRYKNENSPEHSNGTTVIQTTQNQITTSVLQVCPRNNLFTNTPIIMFAYMTTFLISTSYSSSLTHITYQVILMGVSKRKAATVLSSMGIGGLCGRLFHGWFVDRKLVTATTLYESAIVVAAMGTLINPILHSYIGCMISAVTIGTTVGILYPLFYTILRMLAAKEHFATASGFAHFFDGCGIMLGGYLAGKAQI